MRNPKTSSSKMLCQRTYYVTLSSRLACGNEMDSHKLSYSWCIKAINCCIFDNIHHVNTIDNSSILINQSVGEIRKFPCGLKVTAWSAIADDWLHISIWNSVRIETTYMCRYPPNGTSLPLMVFILQAHKVGNVTILTTFFADNVNCFALNTK